MINFLKKLLGFQPQQEVSLNESNLVKEKSLNEKNRLRALKEQKIVEKKKAKAKLLREKADKAFSESVMSTYHRWLDEFQFRLHVEVDESDLRYEENEIEGTIIINGCTFSVTTKLGTVSRHWPAVRTFVEFKCKGLKSPVVFAPNFITNSPLVGQVQPAVLAYECLAKLKKQANLIHMKKVVSAREERKRLKREIQDRNRLRNLEKKKKNSFEQLNQLVLIAK